VGIVTDKPRITVLMPIYNGARYLPEAMESILQQSFTNFEFLIINDGSTDESVRIVNSYTDPRIRLIENDRNMGLVHTLNRGLDLAQGEFIARMDCDDISLQERLEKQLILMERCPEIGVCGGWIEYFMGRQLVLKLPVSDAEIKRTLPSDNPMAHPTVMLRTAVIKARQLYFDPEYSHVEDYELWVRLAAVTCFANIPEVLLKYRIHPEQVGHRHSAEQAQILEKIRAKLKK
jgi:glycosyltransferase involved in cell wall biosynthesis